MPQSTRRPSQLVIVPSVSATMLLIHSTDFSVARFLLTALIIVLLAICFLFSIAFPQDSGDRLRFWQTLSRARRR